MPRFPAASPILTGLWGVGVHGPVRTAALADALVGLMNWALNGPGYASLEAVGTIPVVGTQAVQDAFWTRWPRYAAVGDWQHFANFAAGWPSAALAPRANWLVANVLSQAVRNPAALQPGPRAAEQTLNAEAGTA